MTGHKNAKMQEVLKPRFKDLKQLKSHWLKDKGDSLHPANTG